VGVSLLQDTCENHRLALPNKLFEYLAAGVPVVVSDLPEMGGLVRALGVEPTSVFPSYVDAVTFLERPPAPLPVLPQALFVGVLERYKNVDGLLAAWPHVVPRVPQARLRLVGTGALGAVVERAAADATLRVSWTPRLSQAEVAAALDASTCLVLPSRSEGMGRVVVEAFCRGRPVVGTRVGGTPDIVRDGENGLLVPAEDASALADALVRALSDRELLERLAGGARESARAWIQTPGEYAARMRELVDSVTT
jgi:glycosyltransferase involved in cell wall biosynthesis